jgi:hypothetical protein
MISISIFMTLAALLVLLLFLVGRGAEPTDNFFAGSRGRICSGHKDNRCPPELVRRIFSPEDWEFITSIGTTQLIRVYQAERTKVAVHWICQTTSSLREIMHDHALASRESPNLEVSRELKLFFHYIELRVICGFLLVLLRLAGPSVVGSLATYASQVSDSIAQAQRELTSSEPESSSESHSSP